MPTATCFSTRKRWWLRNIARLAETQAHGQIEQDARLQRLLRAAHDHRRALDQDVLYQPVVRVGSRGQRFERYVGVLATAERFLDLATLFGVLGFEFPPPRMPRLFEQTLHRAVVLAPHQELFQQSQTFIDVLGLYCIDVKPSCEIQRVFALSCKCGMIP